MRFSAKRDKTVAVAARRVVGVRVAAIVSLYLSPSRGIVILAVWPLDFGTVCSRVNSKHIFQCVSVAH